ncbi:MAG: hypothetical protein QFX38_06415 [Methanothermobacter sp.]|nr:hypothetical protein [Methanothermobacter sp.]
MTKIGKILYDIFVKHPQMKEELKELVNKGLTVKELNVDMKLPCYFLFPDPTSFGCEGCDLKCNGASTASLKLKEHSLKEIVDRTHFYKHLEILLRPTINLQ